MSYEARNDLNFNIKFLNKYFEVKTLDETLAHHRNEYQTRTEHLQKRQEALHDREVMFKEKILSYEIYIKELAMKRDRSFRRIDDEKNLRENKQIEMNFLQQEIEKMQEEKLRLQEIVEQYQPHLNLLTQIIDQSDRFHSIEEMIDKFDMLYASYQDILQTIRNSNEELNHLQRQLLIIIEKKNNQISMMNNRIHELEQNLIEIHQRIEKIQIEIRSYQQISTEHLTENGAIKIAIESMFDLVQKYSHRSRKKQLNRNNQCLFDKLNGIDIFLSDLIYYVDYVNTKQKKILPMEHSIQGRISDEMDDHHQWRDTCEINQRQSYFQIRGEDNVLYTIQMMNRDKSKTSQNLSNKEKKNSSSIASTPKLQSSIDVQPRLSTRASYKLANQNEQMRTSISINKK